MIGKNIKYYRLRNNMSLKAMADSIGVTSMAISNYENNKRTPDSVMIYKIAESLGVKTTDLLAGRKEDLIFTHREFRRNTNLAKKKQVLVREAVEEYLSRFYSIVEILGEKVLPDITMDSSLEFCDNPEKSAAKLRQRLSFAENGPVGNLVSRLENIGILIIYLEIDAREFSGINGSVSERPYIAVKSRMTPERKRFTIVHELVHMFFGVDNDSHDERMCDKVAGAFLFNCEDAYRELGPKRTSLMGDTELVAKEYGISMSCLARRARDCGIASSNVYEKYCKTASSLGWRKEEPVRISEEEPTLFKQLVFRAVSEEEISIRKGSEILHMTPSEIEKICYPEAV